MKLRTVLGTLGMILGVLASTPSRAEYPDRPIRLVVPYQGGSTDAAARALAAGLSKELNQPVLVENRPGAGTVVGTTHLAKSAPDGYTIGIGANGNLVMNGLLLKNLPYDADNDLRLISSLIELPSVFLVNARVPAKNLAEFKTWAQSVKEGVNFASVGRGNVLYIGTRALEGMLGLQMTEVAYKGGGPALTAVVGGEVSLFLNTMQNSLPMLESERVKAIAVPSPKRLRSLPSVPTVAEQGYPELNVATWFGVAVPAATPQPVVERLQAAIRTVRSSPQFVSNIQSMGLEMMDDMDDAQLKRFLERDKAVWAGFISRYNISVDQ